MQNQHTMRGALQLISAQPRKECTPIGRQAFGNEGRLRLASRVLHDRVGTNMIVGPPPPKPHTCSAIQTQRHTRRSHFHIDSMMVNSDLMLLASNRACCMDSGRAQNAGRTAAHWHMVHTYL